MVILVVFNSFNVVKNLKKPDPVARQVPPLYTTKVIFNSSSIFSGLEFWSVNHTSIYQNSESIVFKNIKFLGEICNN